MRTTGLLFLFVSICFYQSTIAQGIEFFDGTWKEALEEAKVDDKIIFVDAYAQWCGPCKNMAKNVFTQAEVGEFFNSNFINLKLDMETKDGVTFGHEYPVSAYPTLLFLNSKGEIVKKVTGGKKAKDLIALGQVAIKSYDRSADYAVKYEEGDRSFDLMVNYVRELNKVDKPSQKIANDYIASKPDLTKAQRAEFLYAAVTESDSKLYEELIKVKSSLKDVPAAELKAKIKKVSLATVAKAVEYDYIDLLTEAIDNYKKADLGDDKRFEQEAKLQYNLLAGNYDEWKALSNKYLKKYAKKEPELYKRQLAAMKQEFRYEKDFDSYACDVCKDLVKNDDSMGNYSAYIELLIGCKQYAEARKVTKEAIKKAQSRDKSISHFERFMDYLDKV